MLRFSIVSLFILSLPVSFAQDREGPAGPPFNMTRVIETVSSSSMENPFLIDSNPVYGPSGTTQSYPSVAFDGTNYLAVWEDHRSNFNDDIYAARVSPQGVLLDPGGILVSTATGNQQRPSVAFDGLNYLVVWQDQRKDQGDIYCARITTSGVLLDPSGIPVSKASNGQLYPYVIKGGINSFVVWEDARSGSYYQVYGARISSIGSVLDPGGIPISTGMHHQRHPCAAHDGNNYMVVWEDNRNGSDYDIYTARVDPAGKVLDPSGVGVSTGFNDQKNCSIIFNGIDYFLAWEDLRGGAGWDIYGARVNVSGSVLDPSGIEISCAANNQSAPSVTYDGSNALVAWTDLRSGSYTDIYSARVDSSGTVLDPWGIVISQEVCIQGAPALASDGINSLAVWHDTRHGGSWAIYGARISPAGAVIDPSGIILSILPYNQYYPAAAFDGTNYMVVWQDYRNGADYNIYAARVSPTGKILDPKGIAVTTESNWQGLPSIAFDGKNYLVAWTDFRNNGEIDIYGARIDSSGKVLDPSGIPICKNSQLQMFPSIAFNGLNYLVVWHDWRNYNYDIYGARVDVSGKVLDPGGLRICDLSSGQYYPAAASDEQGYLVVWHDSRHGSYAVYGVRVDSSGTVMDPGGFSISKGSRYLPAVAFGKTDYLVTWDDYRSGNSDIYGARVSTGGTVLDPYGLSIAKGSATQGASYVGFDGYEFMVAWQDYRNNDSFDIRGAKVSAGGNVGAGFDLSQQFEDQITPALSQGHGTQMLVAFCGFAESINGLPANTMRIWGVFSGSSLMAEPTTISASTGGSIDLDLHGGVQNAGRDYIVLGCLSGTSPGATLPGGEATLPLNWDAFTNMMIPWINTAIFSDFLGVLDPLGAYTAQINATPLSTSLVGATVYFAYCLTSPFDFASNPVDIGIVP